MHTYTCIFLIDIVSTCSCTLIRVYVFVKKLLTQYALIRVLYTCVMLARLDERVSQLHLSCLCFNVFSEVC